ncbi:MAG: CopG family transcriptional regulator [Nitrosomonadales bacterium]|nr:CopG family transcriptional regulator [Nitrosomonadales bacterium]
MQRTIISLEPEERDWLAHRAQVEHVPQTEVVRRALQLYRKKAETQKTETRVAQSFEKLARLTSGIRQGEDGLVVQQHLRDEWGGR